jgi:O-acetyl-ADP-ribose deacetylase (regulator of RNase III)
VTAPSWRVAEILASHVAHAADTAGVGGVSEEAIVEVALDCATGELIEAFGHETADRVATDERAYALCEALLTWHWQTGGAL